MVPTARSTSARTTAAAGSSAIQPDVDLGCLLCFDVKDGKFLWQHSSEKLPTGRVHDWPHARHLLARRTVEGDRLWFVTSRGEVRCLDTEGFHDGENDGARTKRRPTEARAASRRQKQEADVIWIVDMMKELGVSQHNMCSCSVTAAGDMLFVNTSNGVDDEHNNIPAPDAPSFIAMDKNTGKVLWTDNSPGAQHPPRPVVVAGLRRDRRRSRR